VFDAPGDVLVADALFWLLGWFIRAVHAFVALLVVLVIYRACDADKLARLRERLVAA
jgi:hypothetical protein